MRKVIYSGMVWIVPLIGAVMALSKGMWQLVLIAAAIVGVVELVYIQPTYHAAFRDLMDGDTFTGMQGWGPMGDALNNAIGSASYAEGMQKARRASTVEWILLLSVGIHLIREASRTGARETFATGSETDTNPTETYSNPTPLPLTVFSGNFTIDQQGHQAVFHSDQQMVLVWEKTLKPMPATITVPEDGTFFYQVRAHDGSEFADYLEMRDGLNQTLLCNDGVISTPG